MSESLPQGSIQIVSATHPRTLTTEEVDCQHLPKQHGCYSIKATRVLDLYGTAVVGLGLGKKTTWLSSGKKSWLEVNSQSYFKPTYIKYVLSCHLPDVNSLH